MHDEQWIGPEQLPDRPSWSHYPDGFSFRRASWADRARVVGIVLVVVLVGLAGSIR